MKMGKNITDKNKLKNALGKKDLTFFCFVWACRTPLYEISQSLSLEEQFKRGYSNCMP